MNGNGSRRVVMKGVIGGRGGCGTLCVKDVNNVSKHQVASWGKDDVLLRLERENEL